MTKDNILEAGYELIVEIGIENFSMRKLATKLKCQPSTIYHHFKDKEHVLNEVVLYVLRQNLDEDNDVPTNLHDALFKMYTQIYEHKDQFMFMRRYSKSKFITDETRAEIHAVHCLRESQMKVVFDKVAESGISKEALYYLTTGPLLELINNDVDDEKIIYEITGLISKTIQGSIDEHL